MTKSELRNAFIEIIKQKSYPNTIPGLVFEISLLCLKSGFITGEDIRRNFELERYEREKTAGKVFLDKYWIEISSVFWEFVANGTLALGYGPYPGEYDLSHFKITEYGKQWLTSEDKPIPEDYDGYLDYLRTNVENIDEVMFVYISEAINTFKNRNIFASAVMLGAAAEKMIYMLAEGIVKFPINRDLKKVILEALKPTFRTSGRVIF